MIEDIIAEYKLNEQGLRSRIRETRLIRVSQDEPQDAKENKGEQETEKDKRTTNSV